MSKLEPMKFFFDHVFFFFFFTTSVHTRCITFLRALEGLWRVLSCGLVPASPWETRRHLDTRVLLHNYIAYSSRWVSAKKWLEMVFQTKKTEKWLYIVSKVLKICEEGSCSCTPKIVQLSQLLIE